MIRVVSIAALLCLLVLVLYLPSAHPPERFLAQIRTEHQVMEQLWGEAPALRILDRALRLQDAAGEATPVPAAAGASVASGVDGAVAREMAFVNQRLFGNSYFRAIDALVLLAAFRASAMFEWMPWLAVAAFAALTDGTIVRLIKAKEFRHHDPELFALFAGLAIMSACAAVVALVVPVTMPPLLMPVVPIAVAVLVAMALANFHRRA